jgi:hypothetical protein
MSINWARKVASADRMIKKYGQAAVLRRGNATDRPCTIAITNFSARDRAGQLVNLTDRIAYVSAKDLTTPPDFEQDRLITFVPGTTTISETLKIVAPAAPIAPGGIALMWELQVRA